MKERCILVDPDYDLPFAIAYGKLTWFLWVPLDSSHRTWKKINEDLTVTQAYRGDRVVITARNPSSEKLVEKLGLWYDAESLLSNQPREIKLLYNAYPIRFPKTETRDFELLLAAAVLSPQVSWEDNTNWIRALYLAFRNHIRRVADFEPDYLDHTLSENISKLPLSKRIRIRKLGYHARVLVRAFQDYKDKFGSDSRNVLNLPPAEARLALLRIYGIGPKVSMFIVQVTHGDLSAPCVDRHVYRIATDIGLLRPKMLPYKSSACLEHFSNCKTCPSNSICGTYQLMRYNASSLISALLYCFDSWVENI
jgi:endonuclease III